MNYQFYVILVFIIGYLAIVFEHPLKIHKSAVALIMAGACWSIYAVGGDIEHVSEQLAHHLSEISQILLFLIAAMAIVEVMDSHEAFRAITSSIKTRNKKKLLWIVAIITFFLSGILDNLTTSIVMASLLRKLVNDREDRKLFLCVVIIAANAGGAFSPIGDVTTTMLWMKGQISTLKVFQYLFLPSAVSLLVVLLYLGSQIKGDTHSAETHEAKEVITGWRTVLFLGIGSLLFVPVFKNMFHLPPYMGILFALGVMWLAVDIIHRRKSHIDAKPLSAASALQRIDTSSVLFFFGILAAVACLESIGSLAHAATFLQTYLNQDVMVAFIGVLSAIIDNVPLVAATQGMYSMTEFPMDSKLWHYVAYAAGTGGSILIIGSAAGVAIMGIEKIDFIWYMKKVSLIIFVGYLAGIATFLAVFSALN